VLLLKIVAKQGIIAKGEARIETGLRKHERHHKLVQGYPAFIPFDRLYSRNCKSSEGVTL
jgi:hypothetical protein